MMGKFVLCYRGKIVGGIYDDCFLVKPTKSPMKMMLDADREIKSMYDELPELKKKK